MADGKLLLEIVTPDRRALSTEVDEVRAPGLQGGFGVRTGHTPFLSALRPGELVYVAGGAEHHLAIGTGFAQVSDNRVLVLTELAERPEQIDVARAQSDAASATQELTTATNLDDATYELRRAEVERAAARISVARHV